MDENRDLILANFQACTGIDDVEHSIAVLEENDWDLTRAVNSAITQQSLPNHSTSNVKPDVEMIEEIRVVDDDNSSNSQHLNKTTSKPVYKQNIILDDSDGDDEIAVAYESDNTANATNSQNSTTRHENDRLYFAITHDGVTRSVDLPMHESVMALKKKIHELTSIPPCRQALTGWSGSQHPRTDSCTLESLSLSPETRLNLVDSQVLIGSGASAASSSSSSNHFPTPAAPDDDVLHRLNLTYNLDIHSEFNDKRYNLNYSGVKSILDVKSDIYELTQIPYRHQEWLGWPDDIKDDTLLGCSGIDHPTHSLTLRSIISMQSKDHNSSNSSSTSNSNKPDNMSSKKKVRKVSRIDDSEDSSVEEFEDAADNFNADDDIFITETRSRKLQPLIPDKVEDETAGCIHFAEEFATRYGAPHPEFFSGSLEDAIKEACMRPARERRLLALYLHHDGSVLANVFCAQLLCCDSVIQVLAAYFVLWPWDLTFASNYAKFMDSFTTCIGALAASHIKNIPADRLPAMVIINRVRSGIEISSVIQGNVGATELLSRLSETVDVFLQQQKIEVREEEERQVREMILHQQDEAYRASLEQDRLKEELRRQQLQHQTEQRERELRIKQQEHDRKEAERRDVAGRLPAEPSVDVDSAQITKIRVRLPAAGSGGAPWLERRFNRADSLQVLKDWLHVEGYAASEYKLITSYPRRDLTTLNAEQTFEQLNLVPQETVILESR